MSPLSARRIRAGINLAREDAARRMPSMIVLDDDLSYRAYKRTAARYAWANMIGWPTPLPPVPPRQWRGNRMAAK